METKVCTNCKEEKLKAEFIKCSALKDKLGGRCSDCRRLQRLSRKDKNDAYNKQYRIDNREQRRLYNIEYNLKNAERMRLAKIKYRTENYERLKIAQKNSYIKNKDKYIEYRKKYENDPVNRERKNQQKRDRISKDREKYNEKARAYKKKNWERIKAVEKKRLEKDPLYKLKRKIHDAIKNSIERKGYSKKGRTAEILGCSYEFFIEYIEAQFVKGMTWDNVTIDHIKPKKTATTEEEVILLNHYTNLQPLFGSDNSSKKDKLITKQLRLL